MNNKIVIILFFFGKLPWYFSFFLKSCEFNPTIDFLFFTDSDVDEFEIPPNFRVISFGVNDFNNLASMKLGLTINVKNGYKMCDFRPAFGILFSEYIVQYDFWGYSDIDIIYGQIKEFLTDSLINGYDVIFVKDQYPTGFFAILRNDERINNLFKKSKDYSYVFTESNNMLFEECGGYYADVCNGVNILETECKIETFHHVLEKEKLNVNVLYDYFMIEGIRGKLMWDNGVLAFDKKYEVILYHLSDYKNNIFSIKRKWHKINDVFYIDKYIFRRRSLAGYTGLFINNIRITMFKLYSNVSMYVIRYTSNLFSKKVKGLTEGKYYYMRNCITIGQDDNGENYIFYRGEKLYLDWLPFNHNRFFFIASHLKLYKVEGNHFARVFENGNLMSYSYSNDVGIK